MIYLLTAIGLTTGGSSTVHIYKQRIHRTTQSKQYKEQHNNLWECGPCPVLASYTVAFALQVRKKHGKPQSGQENLSQGMNVIGTAIDQKPTGGDGSHGVDCRTAMWKERRNPHTMISKQQPQYYDESIWYYTGCPRRNGQTFGRVFLMLNYTDITQNTYIQS